MSINLSRAFHGRLRRSIAALAVFVALCAGPACATVWYVDAGAVPVTYDGLVIGYAGGEVLFARGTVQQPEQARHLIYACPNFGDAAVAIRSGDVPWAEALGPGDPVAGSLPWSRNCGRLVQTVCPNDAPEGCEATGPWAGAEWYAALRFRQGSSTYYGWARLAHTGEPAGPYAPVVLMDFAIDTTPGQPILAGSRRPLLQDVQTALRVAAGLEAPTDETVALLDRGGVAGAIDLEDAAALARLLAAG
jgi:hypothetical protein